MLHKSGLSRMTEPGEKWRWWWWHKLGGACKKTLLLKKSMSKKD